MPFPVQDSRRLQIASIGLAFALFSVVDLIILFVTPAPERGVALLPPIVAGIIALITMPFLLGFFERQQVKIERQQTEIETLHAMDAAIFSEMELLRLLPVAADKAISACDAEASGVVLLGDTDRVLGEAYSTPDVGEGASLAAFQTLVRTGDKRGNDEWETIVAPLLQNNAGAGDKSMGYLTVARRRITNRPFSNTERRLLDALAGTLRLAVINARALSAARDAQAVREELKETKAKQERDGALARAMTESLLPEIPQRIGAWQFSQQYRAQSDEAPVGGDLYDLFKIAPGKWGAFVADVSGKGLKAARQVALVKYALRSYAREYPTEPSRVLNHLNDTLFDEPEVTGFVTLFYAVLDENTGTVTWASAGHETPILRRAATGKTELLPPTGPVLGAMEAIQFTEGWSDFGVGDGLLIYTDGLSEARSAVDRSELLEVEGVERELGKLFADGTASRVPVADAMMDALYMYSGGKFTDDTALLWMQYTP